jgi:uncharacterized membrane protein
MEKNRIEAFSDGVFAIAITLLILEIRIPHVPASELKLAFIAILPKIMAFILSFIIIGVYWVAHHNLLHFVRQVDRTALWLNMLMLLFVVFIPFPTALLGEYPKEKFPAVLYGITIASVNLSGTLFWWYCSHNNRLTKTNLRPRFARRIILLNTSPAIMYIMAMILTLVDVRISYFIYILVPVFFILPNPVLRKILSEPYQEE